MTQWGYTEAMIPALLRDFRPVALASLFETRVSLSPVAAATRSRPRLKARPQGTGNAAPSRTLRITTRNSRSPVMRSLLVALFTLLPAIALANPMGIQVEHVWSRAMPAGATGVVYLTVTNQGAPDTLIGVASPVAASATLHETINDHDVMKMRRVASLPVTPGKAITLAPGGYHIMLTRLKQALVAGMSFPVTLTFAKAGAVTVTATVQAPGAAMPGMDHTSTGNKDMRGMSMGGAMSK
jgi:periplasmic copper chaperone A